MKVPFWATREFRWLVIIGVMALATLGVLAFEILPLLSKRASEPAVRDPLPEDLLKVPSELRESLEGAVDSTSIALLDPAYRSLVLHVSSLSAEEITKEAVPIPYGMFGRDPANLRGRAIHIEAMFLKMEPTALQEKIDGIEYVYRTYLLDPGSNEGDGYVLDLLERPPDLESRDFVAADGLFLRIGEYETETEAGQDEWVKGPVFVKAPLLVGRALRVVERKALPSLDMGPLMIAACGLAAAVFVLWILFQRQANARRLARLASTARPVLAPGPGRPQLPASYSKPNVERKPPPRFRFRSPLRRAAGRGDFLRVTGRQRTLIRVVVLGAALVCMALLAFNYYKRRVARERSPSLDRGAQFLAAFGEADQAWKEIHGAQEKAWLEEK
ncbi:MAG TPA: hypothetical protein VMT52_11885, partial [Planctomycetota bacterium]|nr:hypothetical protein [Planctomycetota bacterium]